MKLLRKWLLEMEAEPEELREAGNTEMDAARALWERDALGLCWPRELTVWMTSWASGPSYGLIVAEVPVDAEVKMGGGYAIVCR